MTPFDMEKDAWRCALEWKGWHYGDEVPVPAGFAGQGVPPRGLYQLPDNSYLFVEWVPAADLEAFLPVRSPVSRVRAHRRNRSAQAAVVGAVQAARCLKRRLEKERQHHDVGILPPVSAVRVRLQLPKQPDLGRVLRVHAVVPIRQAWEQTEPIHDWVVVQPKFEAER